ncbi:MAG: hypothetical protein P8Q92_02480 [Pseudoprimorskyibacter sp.]|nr:hypothetical protein [Pseudoprimorskyibacter sp.]
MKTLILPVIEAGNELTDLDTLARKTDCAPPEPNDEQVPTKGEDGGTGAGGGRPRSEVHKSD